MKRNFPRVALAALLAAMTGCSRPQHQTVVTPAPAPPVVPMAMAPPAAASISIEAVATLGGATSREIHSPISGYVVKQTYQDGAFVRAGDVLFEIDTSPAHTITKITSPIAGAPAHASSGVGDLINPATTLTSVSAIDTITAEFALPMSVYHDHASWFAQLLVQPIAARPDDLRLQLEDGSIYPALGRLSAIETQPLSPLTQKFVASALFPNPDHVLRPGQFAKVRMIIGTGLEPAPSPPTTGAPSQ